MVGVARRFSQFGEPECILLTRLGITAYTNSIADEHLDSQLWISKRGFVDTYNVYPVGGSN